MASEGRETELLDPLNPPPGCAFKARRAFASQECGREPPRPQQQPGGRMGGLLPANVQMIRAKV